MTFVSVPFLISTSETQKNIYFQAIKINKKFIKLHTVSVASPLPLAVTWMFWLMSLNCGIKTTTTITKWLEKVVTTLGMCCCTTVCFLAPWMFLCRSGCSCWNLSWLGLTSREARGSRSDYILVLGRWSSTLPLPGTLWWWPGVKRGELYMFSLRGSLCVFFFY